MYISAPEYGTCMKLCGLAVAHANAHTASSAESAGNQNAVVLSLSLALPELLCA